MIIRFPDTKKERCEAIILLALAFLFNQIAYTGARLIAGGWHHYYITTEADKLFPFVPWTITIYFGCYLFWGINYFIVALQEDKDKYRLFCADTLAKAVCLVVFLAFPTTNIRPEVTGEGIWQWLMRFLYSVDAADNLLPSLHCTISWFCFIGVRHRKDIHLLYKLFSFAAAVAVFISTLTTKQHVIVDVIAGVALSEICYLIAAIPKVRGIYSAFVSRIVKIFGSMSIVGVKKTKK